MFSPGSARNRPASQGERVPPDAKMLKCQGCGQVGTIAGNPVDARQRRHGFYLHDEPNGSQVVACCKCQQIQARASE